MAELKELSIYDIEEIKELFKDTFMGEPWKDDWSDATQLHSYIEDLIGNKNSLALGLVENGCLIGIALGNIKHWYSGTEYCVDEFCIGRKAQGHGMGTLFIKEIEAYLADKGIHCIFLQTERTMSAYQFYKKNGFIELEDHVSLFKDIE